MPLTEPSAAAASAAASTAPSTPLDSNRMSPDERRASISLAAIFALRMLGLFLILPVFAIYAHSLPGGDDPALVGLAMGAYGITQAFLQIPFGTASDRFGRKPVIVFGLLLFAAGSFLAAATNDLHWIIAGRVLQGAGAISAAVTALAADLTRELQRTKAMAMIGSSIGLTFAASLVVAPLLYSAIGMPGIFALTGILALAAIFVLLRVVPAAPPLPTQMGRGHFATVLFNRQLLRMNFGVFVLHLTQTAMWVLLPAMLVRAGLPLASHWQIYLPAVLASFVLMVPAVIVAEKRGKMKQVFSGAIALIAIVQVAFALTGDSLWQLSFWLFAFFVGFNILEATQPSLISRIAPPEAKGAALGIYNTTQSLGLFLGGAAGGLLAKYAGGGAVFAACGVFGVLWLLVSLSLVIPAARRPTVG